MKLTTSIQSVSIWIGGVQKRKCPLLGRSAKLVSTNSSSFDGGFMSFSLRLFKRSLTVPIIAAVLSGCTEHSKTNQLSSLDLSAGIVTQKTADGALSNTIYASSSNILSAQAGKSLSVDIHMNAVPMGVEGYQVCLNFVGSNGFSVPQFNCFWPKLRSDIASGDEIFNVNAIVPAAAASGTYALTASYVRFDGISYKSVAMNLGSGVSLSPEINSVNSYVIAQVNIGSGTEPQPTPTPPVVTPPSTPSSSLNTIYQSSTSTLNGVAGGTVNVNVHMNAVPMGVEGYQVCLNFVGSNGSSVPQFNCFWPKLRSDTASGDETFNVTATIPSNATNGSYSVAASYVRFDGIKYSAASMNVGPGVLISPEIGAINNYVIATLQVSGGGTSIPTTPIPTTPPPTPDPAPTVPSSPVGETDALVKKGRIVSLGNAGEFDAAFIESPNGIFDPATNQWIMYYTGYDSKNIGSIGVATAPNLDGPWTKRGKVLGGSGSGGDATGVTGPVPYFENGVYYLYYIGLNGGDYEAGNTGIYLATATSATGPFIRQGVRITASPAAAWRTNTVWRANFVKRGNTYYCFFNAGNSTTELIGYATAPSISGPWTVDDTNSPLLRPGVGSDWDAGLIGDPYVYKLGNTWYMSYYGVDKGFAGGSDGFATTTDAEFPLGWKKAARPVLTPGGQYTVDGKSANKPWIATTASKLYHFYAAVSDDGIPSICYATADIH